MAHNLNNNDYVVEFLKTNGFPAAYNDGLLAYFRNYFSVTHSSLPDLLARYKREVGNVLLPDISYYFASSEEGVWYDPSDFSTMFQDSAGTIPVTATGQKVARINDKSGNAHHMSQGTAGREPLLQQDSNGKYYLDFDGSNDLVSTAAIDLTGGDEITVALGLHKDSDTTAGTVLEFSTNFGGNTGAFLIRAPNANGQTNYGMRFKGTTAIALAVGTSNGDAIAPATNVISMVGKIADGYLRARLDGRLDNESTAGLGTGNLGNHALFMGSRSGAIVPFNGRVYQVVVRAAVSTPSEIMFLEDFINSKTGAF